MGDSYINNLTIKAADTASKTFKYTILLGSILNIIGSKS